MNNSVLRSNDCGVVNHTYVSDGTEWIGRLGNGVFGR